MEFVDYLSFIQVSIAFNFASAYWKEEGKDDVIEKMFRQLYDEKQLEDSFTYNQMQMKKIESYRPNEKAHDEEMPNITMKQYYEIKEAWEHKTLRILNIYQNVLSRDRSTFFNDVCIILGLYGLYQLCLLPDITKSSYFIFRDAYIYTSEILLIVLFLLLIAEIGLRSYNIRFGIKMSRLLSIMLFIAIAIGSCILSIAYNFDVYSPFYLCIAEDTFIHLTIFITYISYIVYFVVVLSFYIRDKWLISRKIPQLVAEREKLLVNIRNRNIH